MADYTAQDLSEDRLKQAAEAFVRQGVDIRTRVHDLTLAALQSRKFDRDAMRDVYKAITAGVATGAEGAPDMRKAIADGLKGMDQAIAKSAEAGASALRQLASTGRNFSDTELKGALASLKKLEDDFVATVAGVAESAETKVQPELRGALGVALIATGIGLFNRSPWAGVSAIGLAMLSAVVNFFFIPYYPFWSIIVIALDVWVIWSLTRPSVIRS